MTLFKDTWRSQRCLQLWKFSDKTIKVKFSDFIRDMTLVNNYVTITPHFSCAWKFPITYNVSKRFERNFLLVAHHEETQITQKQADKCLTLKLSIHLCAGTTWMSSSISATNNFDGSCFGHFKSRFAREKSGIDAVLLRLHRFH